MRKPLFLLIILVVGFTYLKAQKEEPVDVFNDAEYFFATGEYQESSILFLKLLSLQPDNANLNFRLGMCYLNIPGKEKKSISYLEKAVLNTNLKYKQKSFEETNAPHHAWFYLGNAYRISNDLEKALEAYAKFKDIQDFESKYNIRIVDSEIKACERAKIIKDSPLNLTITNLGQPINSVNNDYAPVLTHDESKIVFMNSQRFYEAIMFSVKVNGMWSPPVNITPQVGSDGNMTPTSLSQNGKELYLVKKEKNNSDIYISRWDGTLWSKAEPLNSNINTRFNETFASVSNDGKSLYFTSDRKESLGGLDIFVSKKQSVGDWGPAQNLGPIINSGLDEESPYLTPDGSALYFSSQGHFNMGGFDVFYAPLNKYGQFDEAVNVGYPINTTSDNLNYQPIMDGKTGYMALFNEETSLGGKDIYKLEILSPTAAPKVAAGSRFDKSFLLDITNTENGEKITIFYDKKTDQVKTSSSPQKNFNVIVTEVK
jgi:tetratricopeptide (TPR) repeat protein